MHRGRLNESAIHIELRGLVIWEVSTQLARTFSQEPTLDSMI